MFSLSQFKTSVRSVELLWSMLENNDYIQNIFFQPFVCISQFASINCFRPKIDEAHFRSAKWMKLTSYFFPNLLQSSLFSDKSCNRISTIHRLRLFWREAFKIQIRSLCVALANITLLSSSNPLEM